MINYGITHSMEIPPEIDIKETKVFIAKNIEQELIPKDILDDNENDEEYIIGYKFDYYEYSKDEYIKMLSDKNINLESQLTDAQLALCDIYEMILGE